MNKTKQFDQQFPHPREANRNSQQSAREVGWPRKQTLVCFYFADENKFKNKRPSCEFGEEGQLYTQHRPRPQDFSRNESLCKKRNQKNMEIKPI